MQSHGRQLAVSDKKQGFLIFLRRICIYFLKGPLYNEISFPYISTRFSIKENEIYYLRRWTLMDDKDFLLIKTLYEEQNITHTAKKLFISQPAISDRLKRLEAEFGCQLFIRQPRGILFTSQGEMLVQYVNEADERYQKIRSALAKPVGKAFGSLSIACSNVFAKYHMPSLLSEFKKKYPAIGISLKSGFSTNRYKDFLEGRFHVCIIRGEHNWSEHKKRLLRDPLCVFSRDSIDLKKLPHLPFVHYITDPALQLVMDDWWYAHYKEPPRITIETDAMDTCLKMVRQGLGVTILSKSCGQEMPELSMTALTTQRGTPLLRDTWMYYRKNYQLVESSKLFVDFMNQKFGIKE